MVKLTKPRMQMSRFVGSNLSRVGIMAAATGRSFNFERVAECKDARLGLWWLSVGRSSRQFKLQDNKSHHVAGSNPAALINLDGQIFRDDYSTWQCYCPLSSQQVVCRLVYLNTMLIYTCPACEQGNHKSCYGTQNPPPGVYGGSKCNCHCRIKPNQELWNADENCQHNIVPAKGGGVKCTKCRGWYCL